MSDHCRSCLAPIRWATTTTGRRMPLNPEPIPGGKWVISAVTGKLLARTTSEPLGYEVHWATCPNADTHRRPRERQ